MTKTYFSYIVMINQNNTTYGGDVGALCKYILILVYTVCILYACIGSFNTSPLHSCKYVFEITVYLLTYILR